MSQHTDIVLPVHGALEHVKECIETLYPHTNNFRLIVVDDMSDEATTEYLRKEVLPRSTDNLYLRTNRQRWFTRASNLGLMLVRSPRAVLLNSDCVFGDGWLDELYAVWDEATAQGHRVALVGSVLAQSETRRWSAFVRGKQDSSDYVTGHCLLLEMNVMRELAAARGTPGIYFNELDQQQIHIASERWACWDLQARGWSTIASFHSAVGHKGGKSWGYNLGLIMGLQLREVDDHY